MIPKALHVVMVEPDAVTDREVRPEQAEILQMRGRCLAIAIRPTIACVLDSCTWLCSATSNSRASAAHLRMKSSEQWCGMVGATAGRTDARSNFQPCID